MKGLYPYFVPFPIAQSWGLIAPSGRYRKDADYHIKNTADLVEKRKSLMVYFGYLFQMIYLVVSDFGLYLTLNESVIA